MLLDLRHFIDEQRSLLLATLEKRNPCTDCLNDPFFATENELSALLFSINAFLHGREFSIPHIELSDEGSALLFKRSCLPWGGFPYPRFHAEVGALAYILGTFCNHSLLIETAIKMGKWQLMTLDHHGLPIHSLFQQEGNCTYKELLLANLFLFSLLSENNIYRELAALHQETLLKEEKTSSSFESLVLHFCKEKPSTRIPLNLESEFCDSSAGFAGVRTDTHTVLSMAKGCKSSMGAFIHHDAQIVGYGPQKLPLGECKNFGLSSGWDLSVVKDAKGFTISSKAPVALHNDRNTGLPIEDVDYSGIWCESTQIYKESVLNITCQFTTLKPIDEWAYVFFAKSEVCIVANYNRLKPRTLDRYKGPPQKIAIKSQRGEIFIHPIKGSTCMEIIPLGGGFNFWSADFLIAFFLENEKTPYSWELSLENRISCILNI